MTGLNPAELKDRWLACAGIRLPGHEYRRVLSKISLIKEYGQKTALTAHVTSQLKNQFSNTMAMETTTKTTRPHKVFGRLLVKADGIEWHVSLQKDGLHLRKKHTRKTKEKVVGFGLLVDTHVSSQMRFL